MCWFCFVHALSLSLLSACRRGVGGWRRKKVIITWQEEKRPFLWSASFASISFGGFFFLSGGNR